MLGVKQLKLSVLSLFHDLHFAIFKSSRVNFKNKSQSNHESSRQITGLSLQIVVGDSVVI